MIFTKEGNIKLCDFGLCRKLSDKYNFEVNTVAGTPRYYPPEMFFGECYSFKSDIWTLAILIFELLLEKEFKLLDVTTMKEMMDNNIKWWFIKKFKNQNYSQDNRIFIEII